jgi:hypothetical protein
MIGGGEFRGAMAGSCFGFTKKLAAGEAKPITQRATKLLWPNPSHRQLLLGATRPRRLLVDPSRSEVSRIQNHCPNRLPNSPHTKPGSRQAAATMAPRHIRITDDTCRATEGAAKAAHSAVRLSAAPKASAAQSPKKQVIELRLHVALPSKKPWMPPRTPAVHAIKNMIRACWIDPAWLSWALRYALSANSHPTLAIPTQLGINPHMVFGAPDGMLNSYQSAPSA